MNIFTIKGVSYDNDVSTLGLFYTDQAIDDIDNVNEAFYRQIRNGYLQLIGNNTQTGVVYTDLTVFKSFIIEGFQIQSQ